MSTFIFALLLQSFIPHWDAVYKSGGETIKLTYDDSIQSWEPMRFQLYRRTGVTTKPVKLAEQTSNVFNVLMPIATTKEYRFFVVPIVLNATGAVMSRGPESNVVLVVRK